MTRLMCRMAVAGMVGLAGCVAGIHEDVIRIQSFPAFDEYNKVTTVAVVPFSGYYVPRSKKVIWGIPHKVTEDNDKVMCDIFTKEFKKHVRLKVVGPEKVAKLLRKRREKVVGILRPNEVQRIGEILKVDALIMGEVRDFSAYKYRMYENSRIALDVRMAETSTGELMWKGDFKLDQEGLPHEVAQLGAELLVEQLISKKAALGHTKKRSRVNKSL
jgi:hypothetical protein